MALGWPGQDEAVLPGDGWGDLLTSLLKSSIEI